MDKEQKIKEEIERRIENLSYLIPDISNIGNLTMEDVGYYAKSEALKSILKFIDSLPEEPANKDLEEAAEVFYDNCNITKASLWDEGILHKMSESKETFIAGAEWQKQQMKETL